MRLAQAVVLYSVTIRSNLYAYMHVYLFMPLHQVEKWVFGRIRFRSASRLSPPGPCPEGWLGLP